jgi:hypothetical protein
MLSLLWFFGFTAVWQQKSIQGIHGGTPRQQNI